MDNVALYVVVGLVLAVAAIWLVILPFKLTRALAHKWGYHASCGASCETWHKGQAIKLALSEQYKKGLRQGSRLALESPNLAKSVLTDNDMMLLPAWAAEIDDEQRVEHAKRRYAFLRQHIDAQDDPGTWLIACGLALGWLSQMNADPEAALADAIEIARLPGQPPQDAAPAQAVEDAPLMHP